MHIINNHNNHTMNEKKQYEAPELTVVEFKVERGYAQSGGGSMNLNTTDDVNEGYQIRLGWGRSTEDNGFWN